MSVGIAHLGACAEKQVRGHGTWTPVGESFTQAVYRSDAGVLTAGDVVAADGETVEKWQDQSGNGHDALVADTAWIYDAASGLLLSDSTEALTTSKRGLNTPSFTFKRIYMVCRYRTGVETSFDGFYRLIGGPGSTNFGQRHCYAESGTDRVMSTNGRIGDDLRKNGVDVSRTNTSTGPVLLPLPLSVVVLDTDTGTAGAVTQATGLGHAPTVNDRSWPGAFGGFVFTDGTESDADRDRVEGFLAHAVGDPSALDAGHPYRVWAP